MAELSLLAKATVVLGLALVAVRCLRGARASVRALVLASTFGVLLILPPAALLLPERVIQVPVAYEVNVALVLEQVDIVTPAARGALSDDGAPTRGGHLPAPATTVRVVWVAVTIGLLLRLGLALWQLRTIRRTSVPWPEAEDLATALARESGPRRRVDVFLHDELTAPMTFGAGRPAIGLPMDATTWDRTAVCHAVAHELEHVRRADWLVLLVTRVVCALYWFHPLVWMASRRLCLEAERACDDAVLRDAERATYAEQLVSLARRVSAGSPIAVLSMAARSDLSARVRAVLDPHQARGRAGIVWTSAAVVGAAALTFAISPLYTVAGSAQAVAPAPASQGGEPVRRFEVASIKPNTSPTRNQTIGPAGHAFVGRNVTLIDLIATAYRTEPEGAEGWMSTDRYDVEARPEGTASWNEQLVMLQTLLADRFNLRVRREIRDTPVYALVAASRGARLTPAAEEECVAPPSERCGGFTTRPGRIAGRRVTVAQIAALLSGPRSGRRVLDNTGINGFFDVELTWTPDPGQLPGPPPDDTLRLDPNGPSLFTAIEEQLGLSLRPSTAPLEHLLIEHAERPSSNDAPQASAPSRISPPVGSIARAAQSPAPAPPASMQFEVASIRRNASAEQRPPGLLFNVAANGQLTAQNMTLFHIIRNAYEVQGVQIVPGANAPDWMERDRWDIVAKAPEGSAGRLQIMTMMQNLLATRFKLVARPETREVPVYVLVPARSDRRLGPQLQPSDGQCEAARLAAQKAGAPLQTPDVERGFCGSLSVAGLFTMSGVTLTDLARYLAPQTGRVVIDRTGLTGTFDLDLKWTPDLTAPAGGPQSAFNDGTSLFAALQEQLGLRLEAQRAPVEVLVIESAERPVTD